jgi:hypothetical protein
MGLLNLCERVVVGDCLAVISRGEVQQIVRVDRVMKKFLVTEDGLKWGQTGSRFPRPESNSLYLSRYVTPATSAHKDELAYRCLLSSALRDVCEIESALRGLQATRWSSDTTQLRQVANLLAEAEALFKDATVEGGEAK